MLIHSISFSKIPTDYAGSKLLTDGSRISLGQLLEDFAGVLYLQV